MYKTNLQVILYEENEDILQKIPGIKVKIQMSICSHCKKNNVIVQNRILRRSRMNSNKSIIKFDYKKAFWIFKPNQFYLSDELITIVTEPNTDFWQKTYYNFKHDNAPALLMKTTEKFFSFTVRTEFDSQNLFDQCGVVIYQNCDNWFKAAIEFHDNNKQWLGSVVTNHGYSDWATVDIGASVKSMWYRLSRRNGDFCIENSLDGITFHQMRIFICLKEKMKLILGY